MRSFVSQAIDVQYGKTMVAYHYDEEKGVVTATFADGSTAAGSTLIGADGHRSNIRDLLLGSKGALTPIPGGVQLVGLTVCYNDAEKARHVRQLHPINWGAFQSDLSLSIWTAGRHIRIPWIG